MLTNKNKGKRKTWVSYPNFWCFLKGHKIQMSVNILYTVQCRICIKIYIYMYVYTHLYFYGLSPTQAQPKTHFRFGWAMRVWFWTGPSCTPDCSCAIICHAKCTPVLIVRIMVATTVVWSKSSTLPYITTHSVESYYIDV